MSCSLPVSPPVWQVLSGSARLRGSSVPCGWTASVPSTNLPPTLWYLQVIVVKYPWKELQKVDIKTGYPSSIRSGYRVVRCCDIPALRMLQENLNAGVPCSLCPYPVTDPGLPRGGCTNSKGGCEKLLFSSLFPKNCMKWKNLGHDGAHPWRPSLDPPMLPTTSR